MRLPRILALAPLLLLPLAAMAPATAAADGDADAERASLDVKQAELAHRLAAVDAVVAAHGTYKLVRDGAFYGDHGVKENADALYTDLTRWIDDFRALVVFVDGATDIASAATRAEINDRLRRQTDAWTELRGRVDVLRDQTGNAKRNLARLSRLGTDTMPTYAAQTAYLDTQVGNLAATLERAETMAARPLLDAWDASTRAISDLIVLKLKVALASSPELAKVLADVEEMFRAESVSAPLVASVNASFTSLRDAVNDYRVFEATRRLAELDAAVASARSALQNARLAPSFAVYPEERITKLASAGHVLFDGAMRSSSKAALVEARFEEKGYELSAACRDASRRTKVDCERFQRVFALPQRAIASLSEAELEVLENEITRIVRGPLPSNEPSSP